MVRAYKYLSAIPLLLLTLDMNLGGPVGAMGYQSTISLSALLVVAWSTLLKGADCASAQEVEQHLEMGKKMLAAGQFADALSHYHAAVDGDPTNYSTYYRRATVYLAMGKSKSALPDLDKVIELKPDFSAARMQRGNVKLKQGKLSEAQLDFQTVLDSHPDNTEAKQNLERVEPLKQEINYAKELVEAKDYQLAIDILNKPIEACPWDPVLREMRGEAYIAIGDYFKAIGDIRPTTKLRNDNTAAYYKLSMLHYQMGEADESLVEIRECLKLDPDHKECHPHYKKVKKLTKQMTGVHNFIQEQKWDDCIGKAEQMLKTEPGVFTYTHRSNGHICHCQSKGGYVEEAMKTCTDILEKDENNIEALCDRAEALLQNDKFEEAIEDYKKAQGVTDTIQRVNDGLKRAEKLLKQSKKRDYYKILGVKRNAKKKEILKAYRKLAMEWHPDKFESEEDKKKAEVKFMDIAGAKEVLTNPEMREKFDNGEDPLDAEEQANSNHNPFGQGFNPFGQGGFNFKFHFN